MKSFFKPVTFRLPILLLAFLLCAPALRADSTDAPKHKPNTKLWKSEKEQGETAFKNRQMTEAETHFQAALAEAENFDAKDYRLAESLTELGEFYARVGRFADAEPLLRRAVDIRRGDPKPLIEAEVQFLYGFTCLQLQHHEPAEKPPSSALRNFIPANLARTTRSRSVACFIWAHSMGMNRSTRRPNRCSSVASACSNTPQPA